MRTIRWNDEPRLFKIWSGMKQRCLNKNAPNYHLYGGKGIKICDEWMDFSVFANWAIDNGYTNSLTLDRQDNNGNYEPSNCRWVTQKTQCRNRSNNTIYTFNGCSMTLAEWSEKLNIPKSTISERITRG